jgi:hypothetical protein
LRFQISEYKRYTSEIEKSKDIEVIEPCPILRNLFLERY